jgi:cellulose synthase/poly-beta-1,6-N-acetylglucosamine synthase-like glycosyltransferase
MSQVFGLILQVLYMSTMVGMAVYGFSCLLNTFLFLNSKNRPLKTLSIEDIHEWPDVTIQLPIFNERYTAERLIQAVARLDYPTKHLQIQVLDDSTDDTNILVKHVVEQYKSKGLNIELIHRVDRSGFKAGALTFGLKTAKGEFIAIFDADFIPEPKWLKLAIAGFSDPKIGCLQTRWGHLNRGSNAFTQAVAMGIDGHFMVEQTARSRNGLFLNFNGTAGIWRRACIEDAGGWQSDTLTEDLDLSYRAQMRGWRIAYLPNVVVPAELPIQVEAFKNQQFRWAKGTFQVIRKLLPTLLRSHTPLHVRVMGFLHMTGYFVHPLMLVTLLLMLPVGLLVPKAMAVYPWAVIASFGPPLMCLVSKTDQMPRLIDRLKVLPFLLLVGFGLSLSNTIAVTQGLFSQNMGTFVRTPKLNVTGNSKEWAGKVYNVPLSKEVWLEMALGIYALIVVIILVPYVGLGIVPWGLIYAFGYFYIAGMSIFQNRQANHPLNATGSVVTYQ